MTRGKRKRGVSVCVNRLSPFSSLRVLPSLSLSLALALSERMSLAVHLIISPPGIYLLYIIT